MQIIISHVNTDFDALASMIAAKKLYPKAQIVISDKQNIPVRQFLNIYRDSLDLVQDHLVDWDSVTEIILVDEASLKRTGDYADKLARENVKIFIYDHHPPKKGDVEKDDGTIEQVGAAVTLLIEEIQKRSLPITSFEATLFGLGIYTDTGSFTYDNTTSRDFEAASFLLEQGMNLEIVTRFSNEIFSPEQQALLDELFKNVTTYYMDGLQIVVSIHEEKKFQKGLATLTRKLLEVTDADAAITVVSMRNRTYIVGRASSDRITLLPLLKKWRGGGHEQAGSATVRSTDIETIANEVVENLDMMIKRATTARDMMTSPVKTILPDTSIEEAGQLMYRYGHSGFPVVEDAQLLGIITRRDLEKANHHGLGHAPVKGYMSTNIITIKPDTTEEEIQNLIIERNIGRLPVVEDGELIGIVSRTNVIEVLHNERNMSHVNQADEAGELRENLQVEMKKQLPEEIYSLLKDISQTADGVDTPVYLIGGIVRDIFLDKENDDIDIVVEGDGVAFAKKLQADYGGDVVTHESFGTATWTSRTGLEIDIASSRLEYYDRPAALPDVETSTLKEDLSRRDFTINAMAIYLSGGSFGQLIDPFRGQQDLHEKKITILHNISFIEDPTRIFRGIRFESRFAFKMDEQTEKLALQSIEKVKDLSAHRIVEEMSKLFTEGHPAKIIRRLFELKFWQQFGVSEEVCEISCNHAENLYKIYEQETSTCTPSWFIYFFLPFYYDEKFTAAKSFALTKPTARLLQEITDLKGFHQWGDIQEKGEFQRFLKDYSDEAILFIVANKSFKNESLIREYLETRRNLPTLLTGEDLIKRGLKPSSFFSEVLLELEVAVLNDKVKTKAEAEAWLESQLDNKQK